MTGAVLVAGFAMLVAAAVILEIRARMSGGGAPSLGELAETVTGYPAGRAAALMGWLWLGWHLFVR